MKLSTVRAERSKSFIIEYTAAHVRIEVLHKRSAAAVVDGTGGEGGGGPATSEVAVHGAQIVRTLGQAGFFDATVLPPTSAGR